MNIKPYTSENIEVLKDNEIFTYGDNMAHIHGAGASLKALKFGAKHTEGFHIVGQTYGIPVKGKTFNVLPLDVIKRFVDDFVEYIVKSNPDKTFLITKIGTGLSGYSNEDIAPLFKNVLNNKNCILPEEFVKIIVNKLSFDEFKELFPVDSTITFKKNNRVLQATITDFDNDSSGINTSIVNRGISYVSVVDFEDVILY